MKIDKAIKTQADYLDNPFLNFHPDLRESMKLGIEALKRVALNRRIGNTPKCILLIGESK